MIIIRRYIYYFLFLINNLSKNIYPEVAVFCYHSISKNDWYFSTDPIVFKIQIEKLKKTFQFISYQEFKEFMKGNFRPKKPAILLTFDDGYKDLVRIADYLESEKIYPIAFVLSNIHNANRSEMENNNALLTDEEVKNLQSHGWTIGAHTATHPNLSLLNKKGLESEILRSREILLKKFGECEVIAYPKGKYTKQVLDITIAAGYQFGFTMNDTVVTPQSNPLTIPRIGINRSHTIDELFSISTFLAIKFRNLVKTFA